MIIDFQLIIDSLPALARGVLMTLKIAGAGCLIGLTFGSVFGLLQSIGNTFIKFAISLYVAVVRGTPMLVQIMFVTFVLPQLGIRIPLIWSAIITIGFNSTAYISQIIRAGIASVSKGQIEAAKVLGMSNATIIRCIIFPQAIRIVLPALGNEFVTLIKESSLASVVGIMELTQEGKIITNKTYDPMTVWFAVTICYLMLTTILSFIVSKIEQRITIHANAR